MSDDEEKSRRGERERERLDTSALFFLKLFFLCILHFERDRADPLSVDST